MAVFSSCLVGYTVDKISLDPVRAVRPPESEKHRWSELWVVRITHKMFRSNQM